MKEQKFYEVCECIYQDGKITRLLLGNPNNEIEGLRWQRFKTLEGAKKELENSKRQREKQYFYFRNKNGALIDKVSFYERYNIKYEIREVKTFENIIYEEDNFDIELKDTKELEKRCSEETPLI